MYQARRVRAGVVGGVIGRLELSGELPEEWTKEYDDNVTQCNGVE